MIHGVVMYKERRPCKRFAIIRIRGYAMIEISCKEFALIAIIVIAAIRAIGIINFAKRRLPRAAYIRAAASMSSRTIRARDAAPTVLDAENIMMMDRRVAVDAKIKIFRVSWIKDGSLSSGSLK
jgi:hypothetical protein